MSSKWRVLSAAAVVLPLAAACAQTGSSSRSGDVTASGQIYGKSACTVASRSGKCRFDYDKAGGWPRGKRGGR